MKLNIDKDAILPIQYLRGLAALMVVWHHTKVQVPEFDSYIPGELGASGVDIFFVISGFIMLITTANSAVRPAEFLIRRVIRVVPMYWLITLGMVLIWSLAPGLFKTLIVKPEGLIASLLFLPRYSDSFPGQIFPLLVPGWTLNYEMFFYFLFAVTLSFGRRSCPLVLLGILTGLVFIGTAIGPFVSPFAIVYTNPILLEFAAGVLIGMFWNQLSQRIPTSAGLLMFGLGWFLLIQDSQIGGGKFVTVAGAGLIVAGALNPLLLGLSSKSLRTLGDATYAIYLTHIFTLGVLRACWAWGFGVEASHTNALAFAAVSIVCCVWVGVFTHRYFERPLTQYLTRTFVPKRV